MSAIVPHNRFDDVSDALTPEERLWAILYRASGEMGGAYSEYVPCWSWDDIKKHKPNLDCLKAAFERYIHDKALPPVGEWGFRNGEDFPA